MHFDSPYHHYFFTCTEWSEKAEENGIEVVVGGDPIDQDETEQDDSGAFEWKRDGEKAGTGKLVDFGAWG